MKELTIEIRENGGLSIQGAGIKNNIDAAKKIIELALIMIKEDPVSEYINEIIFKKEKS